MSALFKLIKKIVSAVLNLIKKILKKIWPLLLIVAALYFFGPAIGGILQNMGAPTWLTSFLTSAPATLASWGGSVWGAVAAGGASLWAGFSSLSLGTQAAVLTGTAALIAPEETGELIAEAGKTIGGAVKGVASGLTSSIWPLLAIGAGIFFIPKFLKSNEESEERKLAALRRAEEAARLKRSIAEPTIGGGRVPQT